MTADWLERYQPVANRMHFFLQVQLDILKEKGWLQGELAVFEHNTAFMYTAIKPLGSEIQ